jgi:hypothetical protein
MDSPARVAFLCLLCPAVWLGSLRLAGSEATWLRRAARVSLRRHSSPDSHDRVFHMILRESCRTPLLQSGNGSSDPGTSADDGGLLAYLPPALQNNYVQLALLAAFYVFHVGVLCVNTCSVPMSWLKQGAAPVSLSWEIIFGTAGASDPVRHPKKSQLQCASGAGQHGFQRQL